jgi:hypothetical protein
MIQNIDLTLRAEVVLTDAAHSQHSHDTFFSNTVYLEIGEKVTKSDTVTFSLLYYEQRQVFAQAARSW